MTMQLDESFDKQTPYLHKLSPYIPLSEYGEFEAADIESVLLRDVLKDTVIRQLDYAKAKLEQQQFRYLPKPLESLAQENSHVLPNVFNMLNAFKWFMKDAEHADVRETLSIVFHPMIVWVQGFRCVTTPALLVIQSILFSHCDSREETPEQYSAVRAFEELLLSGFPENDCRFITAIIAHQTLLRAAWSVDPKRDPAEVIAYYMGDNEPELAEGEQHYPMVGLALQRTLFPFLENKGVEQEELSDSKKLRRRQLAAALILHCLCLQCRHSRYIPESLPDIKVVALSFMHHLLTFSSQAAGLGFFHYLRYACQGGTGEQDCGLCSKTKKWFKDSLLDKSFTLTAKAQPLPFRERFNKKSLKPSKKPYGLTSKKSNDNNSLINVTLCFPRVPSKNLWLHEDFNFETNIKSDNKNWTNELLEELVITDASRRVIKLIGATVGETVWIYDIKKVDFLLRALGLED